MQIYDCYVKQFCNSFLNQDTANFFAIAEVKEEQFMFHGE